MNPSSKINTNNKKYLQKHPEDEKSILSKALGAEHKATSLSIGSGCKETSKKAKKRNIIRYYKKTEVPCYVYLTNLAWTMTCCQNIHHTNSHILKRVLVIWFVWFCSVL